MSLLYKLLLISFPLFALIDIPVDPNQRYNNSANYANRPIYFLLVKNSDGSVSLQVSPPPFYPQDSSIVNSGIAIIDCDQVVIEFSAAEVAAATTETITFTVKASPNVNLAAGYAMYATLYQWLVNLDPKSADFYHLQGVDIESMSLNGLYVPILNSNDGIFTIFFEVADVVKWVSAQEGAFLSESYIDNSYFRTTKGNDPSSQDFTLEVDFTRIADLADGVYQFYLLIQMNEIPTDTTFLETITNYSAIQQTQINYLFNSVLEVNAYLIGNNALYDPIPADQVILNANRTFLIDQYNKTLDAMQEQWTAYSEQSGLSVDAQTLISQMLAYISNARALSANFALT